MFDIKTKFDFDDILIVPSEVNEINSRSEIKVTYDNVLPLHTKKLPLFTAPMDTVINVNNNKLFIEQGINTIIPRTSFITNGITDINKILEMISFNWVALGLSEFTYVMEHLNSLEESVKERDFYVCVDIANGHLKKLHDEISKWISIFPKLHTMTGNVANPQTYKLLSEIGVEYVRVGIGNGSGCLTTQQTAIGYPMASLIEECYKISCEIDTPAKIIADGGFSKYSDIIKALHLGADMVMLGGTFNKALESCADTYMGNIKHETWTEPGKRIDQYDEIYADMLKHGTRIFKKFRGMSTKEVQSQLKSQTDIKTSEGITRMNQVEYTLEGWTENFRDYLASAMSYTNCETLEKFIGMQQYVLITNNALERFRK